MVDSCSQSGAKLVIEAGGCSCPTHHFILEFFHKKINSGEKGVDLQFSEALLLLAQTLEVV